MPSAQSAMRPGQPHQDDSSWDPHLHPGDRAAQSHVPPGRAGHADWREASSLALSSVCQHRLTQHPLQSGCAYIMHSAMHQQQQDEQNALIAAVN